MQRYVEENFISMHITLYALLSASVVLAFGTQVRGFKPGRSRWIFKGEKIFNAPVCPMSQICVM